MEKQIVNFIVNFRGLNEEEKIKVISDAEVSFLEAVKIYCLENYLSDFDEISIIQEKINTNAENELTAQHSNEKSDERIETLKKSIMDILSTIDLENKYSFSPKQKEILDEFFERTSNVVIEDVLCKVRTSLLNGRTRRAGVRIRNDHFNISSLAMIFPDKYHTSAEINYIEDKYREKFRDLHLDEMGMVDVRLSLSQGSKKGSFYEIEYSAPPQFMKNKYHFYSYVILVTCDMSKKKVFEKKKGE